MSVNLSDVDSLNRYAKKSPLSAADGKLSGDR